MNIGRTLFLSIVLVFFQFVYNLFVSTLFFLKTARESYQPYCQTCTEICGVWRCIDIGLGDSMDKLSFEDIYPLIIVSVIVNVGLGLGAIILIAMGLRQLGKLRKKNDD